MEDTSSPLAKIIADEITSNGPITVEHYMSLCLGHPDHGVYTARDPIGADGDFTTSPEISQMFGELIGLWAASAWQTMGQPSQLHLIELGPGRGTLMADALRATHTLPGFIDALSVHLVETSQPLRAKQAESMKASGIDPHWYDNLASVPPGPTIIIANEFFDALPIRQFVRKYIHWHERLIGLEETGEFKFQTPDEPQTHPLLTTLFPNATQGDIAEICPSAHEVIEAIGERFQANPGAALIIDYGHVISGTGDTLQAVAKHKYTDPLAQPGEADLTAHVDFAALSQSADKAELTTHGPINQGQFLNGLGIRERAKALSQNATKAQARDIAQAQQRLTAPDQMGTLFKVMALTSAGLAPPAPFAVSDMS